MLDVRELIASVMMLVHVELPEYYVIQSDSPWFRFRVSAALRRLHEDHDFDRFVRRSVYKGIHKIEISEDPSNSGAFSYLHLRKIEISLGAVQSYCYVASSGELVQFKIERALAHEISHLSSEISYLSEAEEFRRNLYHMINSRETNQSDFYNFALEWEIDISEGDRLEQRISSLLSPDGNLNWSGPWVAIAFEERAVVAKVDELSAELVGPPRLRYSNARRCNLS